MSESGGERSVRVEVWSRRRSTRIVMILVILSVVVVVGMFALAAYIAWKAANSELGLYLYILLPFAGYIIVRLAGAGREKR